MLLLVFDYVIRGVRIFPIEHKAVHRGRVIEGDLDPVLPGDGDTLHVLGRLPPVTKPTIEKLILKIDFENNLLILNKTKGEKGRSKQEEKKFERD